MTTLAKPIPIIQDKYCPCEVCALTKIKGLRGKISQRKHNSPLTLVSVDICGPIEKSLSEERYFLIIVDCHSRKKWVYPMVTRDESPKFLNAWKTKVELKTGLKLQAVKNDNRPKLMKMLKQ